MPRSQSVGLGRRISRHLAGPQIPQAPSLEEKPENPYLDQERQRKEDEAQNDRYLSWASDHNGGYYDFLVWDWLSYHKQQTPNADFFWQATVNNFPADFYFPAQQMVWNIRSRGGANDEAPQLQSPPPVELTDLVMQNTGTNVINVFAEDLLDDPSGTLEMAWQNVAGVD